MGNAVRRPEPGLTGSVSGDESRVRSLLEEFMSKILMLVGDYAEDYETMVPFQALQMIGHTVHAVCPGKKSGDKIRTAVHDFEGDQTYSEKRGHDFTLNANFDGAAAAQFDALLIPGGRAPEYVRLDKQVQTLVHDFHAAGKPIAAVCHGVQVLAAVPGLLKGRTVTAYPACEPEVTLAGGTYKAVGWEEAVVNGNLVTAPAWPAHPRWLSAFNEMLGKRR